ncbi:unnamed protein product [Orchesella dallaii]|uniref:Uncharacterized protein n=1 Tax=Orchesella dallaii TaxID=48710 RepID=A0ABP1RHN0_9HEXA
MATKSKNCLGLATLVLVILSAFVEANRWQACQTLCGGGDGDYDYVELLGRAMAPPRRPPPPPPPSRPWWHYLALSTYG